MPAIASVDASAQQVDAFEVSFARKRHCLEVLIAGSIHGIDDTVSVFMRIAAELRRVPATRRLLMLDDTIGVIPDAAGFRHLLESVDGHGFQDLRIAYVERRSGAIAQIEVGELMARDAGYTARAFHDEATARLWLRYGES